MDRPQPTRSFFLRSKNDVDHYSMSYSNISAPGNGVWKDELIRYLGDDTTVIWTTHVGVWTTLAFLIAALAYLWSGHGSKKKRCYPHPLPPRSTYGLFETLQRYNSVHFHEVVLNVTRNQGKIVEINLWPIVRVRMFHVNDPKVARKILENPNSLKPREVYAFFDGMMGGTSFISEEGERYKHPRKAVSFGLSHSNMDDMLRKMHDVMDQWITNTLGKNHGDVVHVDIGVEMQRATIQSIGKIAFGYDFSTDEAERALRNIIKVTDEFGSECEKNPLRKSPIGIFLWAAKREASRCVRDTRLLVQNALEAHYNKPTDEQKKAKVLNELIAPGRYETIGGADALISDMALLFFAGFDTSKFAFCMQYW
jgi:cytochrome P450